MENKKILQKIQVDGTVEEVELITCIRFKDTQKEYAIYTRNETDDKGNTTIYVSSIIDRTGEIPKCGGIATEEEWSRIKDVLRELAKDN